MASATLRRGGPGPPLPPGFPVALAALVDALLFLLGLCWRVFLFMAGGLTYWGLPVWAGLGLVGAVWSAVLYRKSKDRVDLLSLRLFVGSICLVVLEALLVRLI